LTVKPAKDASTLAPPGKVMVMSMGCSLLDINVV
jgi:hypothetical protein